MSKFHIFLHFVIQGCFFPFSYSISVFVYQKALMVIKLIFRYDDIGLRFNLYKNSNNCSSSWSRDNLKSVTNEILHFMLHKYTRKRPILHVYMISLCMRGDKRRKKEKRNKEKETPSAPMKEKQKKKRAATG